MGLIAWNKRDDDDDDDDSFPVAPVADSEPVRDHPKLAC